jgi:hypothetical protein
MRKNLRKFSLSKWQFIGPTTKQRNVFFRQAEIAGFGPWQRDMRKMSKKISGPNGWHYAAKTHAGTVNFFAFFVAAFSWWCMKIVAAHLTCGQIICHLAHFCP